MNNEDALALIFTSQLGKLMSLYRIGFFEMKNGSITVHFDHEGKMRRIEYHKITNLS